MYETIFEIPSGGTESNEVLRNRRDILTFQCEQAVTFTVAGRVDPWLDAGDLQDSDGNAIEISLEASKPKNIALETLAGLWSIQLRLGAAAGQDLKIFAGWRNFSG